MDNSLLSISPIDGRYRYAVEELYNYFSEYSFFKYSINIELQYLISLSEIKVIRKLNSSELKFINTIIENFDIGEAKKIKRIERVTRHDKKAIEYYLKEKLSNSSLKDIVSYLHFALTSEDITNIAIRQSIKDALLYSIIPSLKNLNSDINSCVKKYNDLHMLARTHGQAAVPTTLGKEFLVFSERLKIEIKLLEKAELRGKFSGAVGNYSAHYFAYPEINWQKFSINFLRKFEIKQHYSTTQIAPYEDLIYIFQTIQRINGIILDFNQDIWRYISDGWFIQEQSKEKVGSSTMPQKINPINFEQSEGNIIIANSLIDGLVRKLPISRLQRDLSDSTISRNFGVTLAHSFLAYKLTRKGLSKIRANKATILESLNSDWSILSEAIQIYLKIKGYKNGYETVKSLTRGKKLNKENYLKIINKLPISDQDKSFLIKLSPETY